MPYNNNKGVLKRWMSICFLISSFFHGSLSAQQWQEKLNFTGFYTLDVSVADESTIPISNADNRRVLERNEFDLKNSLLGGQLDIQISDNLSAVLQGNLQFDGQDDVEGDLDWAYLSYDFGHDLQLRAGKFQTSFLQGTELRKVGFSRLWARPLIPGNGASGFNDYRGINLLKSINHGRHNLQLEFAAGDIDHNLAFINGKQMLMLAGTYQVDDFWLRSALMSIEYDYSTEAGIFVASDAHARLGSIEAEWAPQNWQFNAGVSQGDSDFTPNDSLRYLSIARTFESFSPYFYYARRKQASSIHPILLSPEFSAGDSPPSGPMPPPMGGPRPPRNGPPGQLGDDRPPRPPRRMREGDAIEQAFAIGVRWDLKAGQALKLQLQRTLFDTDENAGVALENANLLTFTYEGVF